MRVSMNVVVVKYYSMEKTKMITVNRQAQRRDRSRETKEKKTRRRKKHSLNAINYPTIQKKCKNRLQPAQTKFQHTAETSIKASAAPAREPANHRA